MEALKVSTYGDRLNDLGRGERNLGTAGNISITLGYCSLANFPPRVPVQKYHSSEKHQTSQLAASILQLTMVGQSDAAR